MDTNNNFELEQMRAQLGILKQKLEKQDIVNERLLRRSMKNTEQGFLQISLPVKTGYVRCESI